MAEEGAQAGQEQPLPEPGDAEGEAPPMMPYQADRAVWGGVPPTLPFDRFGERARKALALAQEEAKRFDHTYIGTEHILLGVLREGVDVTDPSDPTVLVTQRIEGRPVYEREGFAVAVLMRLGVAPPAVREAVEGIIGQGDRPMVGEAGLTPRAKRVIELAVEEARRLRHGHVGTEHVLLGLIGEGEGIAANVLRDTFGLTADQVRAQVIEISGSRARGGVPPGVIKANVVTCRLDDRSLGAIDALIEAGIRSTRSDAASWLIAAGIEAHRSLFDQVSVTVEEIRRLRTAAQIIAQQSVPVQPPIPPA